MSRILLLLLIVTDWIVTADQQPRQLLWRTGRPVTRCCGGRQRHLRRGERLDDLCGLAADPAAGEADQQRQHAATPGADDTRPPNNTTSHHFQAGHARPRTCALVRATTQRSPRAAAAPGSRQGSSGSSSSSLFLPSASAPASVGWRCRESAPGTDDRRPRKGPGRLVRHAGVNSPASRYFDGRTRSATKDPCTPSGRPKA